MDESFIRDVYQSLLGNMIVPVPGVENAFAPGSICDRRYSDMLDAYARLCARLGVADEDEDVEMIINSLLSIQNELCMKMYEYGGKFGDT